MSYFVFEIGSPRVLPRCPVVPPLLWPLHQMPPLGLHRRFGQGSNIARIPVKILSGLIGTHELIPQVDSPTAPLNEHPQMKTHALQAIANSPHGNRYKPEYQQKNLYLHQNTRHQITLKHQPRSNPKHLNLTQWEISAYSLTSDIRSTNSPAARTSSGKPSITRDIVTHVP